MNLLLDTHALLWWLDDNPALPAQARNAIADGENVVFVSAAAIWEIRIKQALGKLTIPPSFREVLEAQPFLFLDITVEHAHAIETLPMHHQDPFDRILVAQARVEKLMLVSQDDAFASYDVAVLQG